MGELHNNRVAVSFGELIVDPVPPKKDIWDQRKREAGNGEGGAEGQGAEINTHQRLEELSWDKEPYRTLSCWYVICFSEEQKKKVVCAFVRSSIKSRPGSLSPCGAVTPGIQGMRASLLVV